MQPVIVFLAWVGEGQPVLPRRLLFSELCLWSRPARAIRQSIGLVPNLVIRVASRSQESPRVSSLRGHITSQDLTIHTPALGAGGLQQRAVRAPRQPACVWQRARVHAGAHILYRRTRPAQSKHREHKEPTLHINHQIVCKVSCRLRIS